MPQFILVFWQSPYNICQAARFGHGITFCTHMYDFHPADLKFIQFRKLINNFSNLK